MPHFNHYQPTEKTLSG